MTPSSAIASRIFGPPRCRLFDIADDPPHALAIELDDRADQLLRDVRAGVAIWSRSS